MPPSQRPWECGCEKAKKIYLPRSLRKKVGGDGDERRAGNGTWEKLTDNAGSHS